MDFRCEGARKLLVELAVAIWVPEYPGQATPTLAVWFDDEPEDGLSGFHSKEDRDAFARGEHGPFLRRVTGNTFRQLPARSIRLTQGEDDAETTGT